MRKLASASTRTSSSSRALQRVRRQGVVLLDELDNLATLRVPDVSREGVQRDLLNWIRDGRITKHGMVKTDHMCLSLRAGSTSPSPVT